MFNFRKNNLIFEGLEGKQSFKRVGNFLILGHHCFSLKYLSTIDEFYISFMTKDNDDSNSMVKLYGKESCWAIYAVTPENEFFVCDFSSLEENQKALEFMVTEIENYKSNNKKN